MLLLHLQKTLNDRLREISQKNETRLRHVARCRDTGKDYLNGKRIGGWKSAFLFLQSQVFHVEISNFLYALKSVQQTAKIFNQQCRKFFFLQFVFVDCVVCGLKETHN